MTDEGRGWRFTRESGDFQPGPGEVRAAVLPSGTGSATPGQCSLCENNCPLESPGCGKGVALARQVIQRKTDGKYY